MTNAGKLKEMLKSVPDETLIVTTGSDHSYVCAEASEEQAELDPKTRGMWEYWDEENKNKKSNKVINVFVIK